jgi:hypothetical protein
MKLEKIINKRYLPIIVGITTYILYKYYSKKETQKEKEYKEQEDFPYNLISG